MFEALTLANAFVIGLLGASHCLGMCGGISASMCIGSKGQLSLAKLIGYNLGRIASYTIAGGIFGALGWSLMSPDTFVVLRSIAALMLILMGLYVGQWYRGLSYLEQAGAKLWQWVQPLGKHLIPVTSIRQVLILGALWGWLPCGLVYSTLLWSFAAADPWISAQLMFAFGLGTLPAMLATGFFSQQIKQLLQHKFTYRFAGALLIVFGLLTLPVDVMSYL